MGLHLKGLVHRPIRGFNPVLGLGDPLDELGRRSALSMLPLLLHCVGEPRFQRLHLLSQLVGGHHHDPSLELHRRLLARHLVLNLLLLLILTKRLLLVGAELRLRLLSAIGESELLLLLLPSLHLSNLLLGLDGLERRLRLHLLPLLVLKEEAHLLLLGARGGSHPSIHHGGSGGVELARRLSTLLTLLLLSGDLGLSLSLSLGLSLLLLLHLLLAELSEGEEVGVLLLRSLLLWGLRRCRTRANHPLVRCARKSLLLLLLLLSQRLLVLSLLLSLSTKCVELLSDNCVSIVLP